jgi:hypothetical protein
MYVFLLLLRIWASTIAMVSGRTVTIFPRIHAFVAFVV